MHFFILQLIDGLHHVQPNHVAPDHEFLINMCVAIVKEDRLKKHSEITFCIVTLEMLDNLQVMYFKYIVQTVICTTNMDYIRIWQPFGIKPIGLSCKFQNLKKMKSDIFQLVSQLVSPTYRQLL
jgi:hypothetical protein